MEIIKTDALLLRSIKHSESSKIVTLFTEQQGRVSALAKGVRRAKSHQPLDTFSLLNVVYRWKPSREIQLLTSTELLQPFLGIRDSLAKMTVAFGICDLILRTLEAEDPHPGLFVTTAETLKELDKTEANADNFYWYFLIKLAGAVGFGLTLDRCGICGKSVSEFSRGKIRLDYAGGRLICPNCKAGGENIALLRPETSKAIQFLSFQAVEKIGRLKLSAEAGGQLESLLFNYLRHHVENFRRPRIRELSAK